MKPSPIKTSQPVKWGRAESGRRLRLDLLFPPPWLLFPAKPPAPPSFLLIYFPSLSFLCLFIIFCSSGCQLCMSRQSQRLLFLPLCPFCSLSNLPLSLHTYSFPGILASSPHLLLAATPLLSSGSSVDFLSPRFFFFFLFRLSLYATLLLPFLSWQSTGPIWCHFFQQTASDSCAHHPICPRAIRAGHKRHKQSSISFFASLQLFSLLSFLTCVSFFSPHSPVILPRLYCRSWSVSSPSKRPPRPIIRRRSLARFASGMRCLLISCRCFTSASALITRQDCLK